MFSFLFLSVYCNVIFVMIKKEKEGRGWRLNYILPVNETKFGVWQISPIEMY